MVDPGQIVVTGEGLTRGLRGKECTFQVNIGDLGGNISVTVESKQHIYTDQFTLNSCRYKLIAVLYMRYVYGNVCLACKMKVKKWTPRGVRQGPLHTFSRMYLAMQGPSR